MPHTFNTSGLWFKPINSTYVEVILIGGGAGGCGGNSRLSGWGGGSGGCSWAVFLSNELPNSASVIVGKGGHGGEPWKQGEDGGDTIFSDVLAACGGKASGKGGFGILMGNDGKRSLPTKECKNVILPETSVILPTNKNYGKGGDGGAVMSHANNGVDGIAMIIPH